MAKKQKNTTKKTNHKNSKIISTSIDFEKKRLNGYYFIPLLMIIGIVPLITFAKAIVIEGQELFHWKGGANHLDFFSWWKSIWFQVFVVTSLAFYFILLWLKKVPFKFERKYYIPLIVYALFVILSAITSDNRIVAMRGFIEQFQGMYVLLCYVALVFLMFNYVNNERDTKIVLYGFIFSASLIALLGFSQYFGFDFYKTLLGRKAILPQEFYDAYLNSLKFNFGEYTIYASLYNTNFVGSFAAMMLPISLSLFMFVKENKEKIIAGIFSWLMFFTWIGCNSRAGYVGFMVAFIIIIIVFRKEIAKNLKSLLILLAIFIVTTLFMNNISDGRIFGQFKKLSITNETERLETISEKSSRFKNIEVEDFKFTIETESEILYTILDENQLIFKDESEEPLEIFNKDNQLTFADERYKNYQISVDNENGLISYKVSNVSIRILMTKNGFRILSTGGRLADAEYPPYLKLFDGREKFASSRGYIWSRSIPMLKNTILLGYGPDNYAIHFPQDDFVGKANSFNSINMVVDKPHNMYLQIGLNTGVISLIAILALFLIYFIDSMRLYIKYKFATLEEFLGAGILTAIVAYLAAGMFNDHIISVSPTFWALFGLGLSINYRLKKRKLETRS